MSARHSRPSRWKGSSRALAFGVASLAIAAVGTTQGTGAFYYDAVHLPVSITAAAPVVAQECYDAGFGAKGGSQAGFNDAVLVVGTEGDDTIILDDHVPNVDASSLKGSPFENRLQGGSTDGWKLYHFDLSSWPWKIGAEMSRADLATQKDHAFVVLGGGGDDVIVAGNKNDCLVGGDGSDLLYGDNSQDVLIGGPGTDWIYGGNAKDQDCSAGDHLYGGNGKDACEKQDDTAGTGAGGGSGSTQPLTTSLVQQPADSQAPAQGGAGTGDTTTADTTPPSQPDQAAGPSQEGTTG